MYLSDDTADSAAQKPELYTDHLLDLGHWFHLRIYLFKAAPAGPMRNGRNGPCVHVETTESDNGVATFL